MPSTIPLHLQGWQCPRTAEPPESVADTPEVDPLTASFKARYTAYERTISAIFPTTKPCCASDLQLDGFNYDDGQALNELNGADGDARAPPPPPPQQTRQEEDEDYDMDEDDTPPPPVVLQTSKPSPDLQRKPSPAPAAMTRELLEASRKASEDRAKQSFSTIFHTLESDREAMLSQQKLEESDRQVNLESSSSHPSHPAPGTGKLSSVNLGASSLTLKHLIARIDQKRERVAVSDMELRNLMSEVKKNRSKWANEDKVGQEELYEAAEKVVLELRAQTEHSTAFLNRVSKREAPDYFNVIKQPMDLGQVMKKLKAITYKSKKEFVDDIMLIWQNCLSYNADPNHYLRKHALAMKKMTLNIIPLIPDITIRDRAEVEAEEAGGLDADAEAESDDEPIMSSRLNRKGPGTTMAKKGVADGENGEVKGEGDGTPGLPPPIIIVQNPAGGRDSPIPVHMSDYGSQNGFGTPPPPTGVLTPLPNGMGMGLDGEEGRLEIEEELDEEYKVWKTLTKKSRANLATERHKLFRGNRLQTDEPALLRTRTGMGRYVKREKVHGEVDEDVAAREQIAKLAISSDADAAAEEEDEMVPNYYQVMCGVPELPGGVEWKGEGEPGDEGMGELRLAPQGIFVQPNHGVSKLMDANMKLMQDTRKVCSKIAVIKQMQAQTQLYANQFTKYDPAPFKELEPEEFVVSSNDPVLAADTCRAGLQRSIGKVFYHVGFEDFAPSALELVTDMTTDFFAKLSRMVLTYQDSYLPTGRLPPDEIILLTLKELGQPVEDLEGYVKDDIERLGSKLEQTNGRMEGYLKDLLRPALQDIENPDGTEQGLQHFVSGDFSEDIGDDFFGFKELGLDQEFGLGSLSVPMHLLQGRLSSNYIQQGNLYANSALAPTEHPQPPPFEPLSHALLKPQIGLVQNFFLAKLHANGEEPLVEDDELPIKQRAPKPRLPPTGKITLPRKRVGGGQGGGSKKKKKPNPPPLAVVTATVIKGEHGVGGVAGKMTPPGEINGTANGVGGEKEGEGQNEGEVGMISPESIGAS